MRDQVTLCIKTIHRSQCCAALVRSIHEHCAGTLPTIHVLDDGKPELRFSVIGTLKQRIQWRRGASLDDLHDFFDPDQLRVAFRRVFSR